MSTYTALGLAITLVALSVGAPRYFRRNVEQSAAERATQTSRWLACAAVSVYIFGTLTFRGRSVTDLTDTPVDNAASIRLICGFAALALAGLAFLNTKRSATARPPLGPVHIYMVYCACVLISSLAAVNYQLVLFRFFDLTVCVTVALAVTHFWPGRSLLRGMLWAHILVVPVLVISYLIDPAGTLAPSRGVIPFRLEGSFPILTYNTIGMYGLVIFALGLARAGRLSRLAIPVGLLLVFASQYRTGYIALAVMILMWLWLYPDIRAKVAAVLAVVPGYFLATSSLSEQLFVRGEQAANSLATLSGRTEYWARAFEVVQRSPVIGTGLSSGTRYEVLGPLGYGQTSTIHSTWVEAYLGTGLLGLTALVFYALWTFLRAYRFRATSIAPLLITVALIVRSFSGSTVELSSTQALTFLLCAILVSRRDSDDSTQAAMTSESSPTAPCRREFERSMRKPPSRRAGSRRATLARPEV